MKKVSPILYALIPAIIVFILVWKAPFYSLDAMLCDTVYSQMSGANNNIIILSVDEETLSAYGPFTEWSRDRSAQLMEMLTEKDVEPAVLAFDVMFVGESDKQVDDRLAEAAGKMSRVVMATNLVTRGKLTYLSDGTPHFDVFNIESEEMPYAALDKKVNTGFANARPCKDGFVRTVDIVTEYNGEKRYSFAAEIYKEYMDALDKSQDAKQQLVGKKQKHFFYSAKPGEYQHFSLVDVLEEKVPTSILNDAIVLVGAYAPGMQDAYLTPAGRREMYGVEINANIINALIYDKTADVVNPLLMAFIAAAIVFVYVLFARRMKMYASLILALWIVLAEGIIGRILATHGYIISLVYFLIVMLLVAAWMIIEKYVIEGTKKRQILNVFKKYMAPQVIDSLAKDENFEIQLGGVKRHVAVLFVDIRGFTSMSEVLTPEEVVQILNKYLSLVTQCIFDHDGMLDKFIGDAGMAIFNAPNDQDDYVFQAVCAGLQMQQYGASLAVELEKEYGRSVNFGVGVHVGEAVVGNIGSVHRMDYTAIGDTVNTASRIEGKAEKGELLISEETYELVKDRIDVEFKDAMSLKGKSEPVRVYRVKGIKEK